MFEGAGQPPEAVRKKLFFVGSVIKHTRTLSEEQPARLVSAAFRDGWSYLLTENGELTVEESFRCSGNIIPPNRRKFTCNSAALAVSPFDPSICFIDIEYKSPNREGQGRHQDSLHESLLVTCTGATILTHNIPSIRNKRVTCACWLKDNQLLMGCNNGDCLVLTLERSSNKNSSSNVQGIIRSTVRVQQGSRILDLAIIPNFDNAAVTLRESPDNGTQTKPRDNTVIVTSSSLLYLRADGDVQTLIEDYGNDISSAEQGIGEIAEHCTLCRAPESSVFSPTVHRAAWLSRRFLNLLDLPAGPTNERAGTSHRTTSPSGADQGGADVRLIQIPTTEVYEAALQQVHAHPPLYTVLQQMQSYAARPDSEGAEQPPETAGTSSTQPQLHHSSPTTFSAPRSLSVIMGEWHALVLVAWVGTQGPEGAVVVFSHITGTVVQVFDVPEEIGQPLFLRSDSGFSMNPIVGFVVGNQGSAPLHATRASQDVWPDFVLMEQYDDALLHVEQQLIELQLSEGTSSFNLADLNLPGPSSGLNLDLISPGSDDLDNKATHAHLKDLKEAQYLIWLTRAYQARLAGDYIAVANALGSISPDPEFSDTAPDFCELALWFQPLPEDSEEESKKKAIGLERYLSCKLERRATSSLDALSCCLALSTLEIKLARTYYSSIAQDAPDNSLAAPSPDATEILEFTSRFQQTLPQAAVDRTLRAFGSWSMMKQTAYQYSAWASLLNQLVSGGEIEEAMAVLPRVRPEVASDGLAAIAARNPSAACRQFSHLLGGEQPSGLSLQVMCDTLGWIASRRVPATTRDGLTRLLQSLIDSGERRPAVHDLYLSLLMLAPDLSDLHRYIDSEVSHDVNLSFEVQRQRCMVFNELQTQQAVVYHFNVFRAVRLAKTRGLTDVAIKLLCSIQAFEQAVDLTESLEQALDVVSKASPPLLQQQLVSKILEQKLDEAVVCGLNGTPSRAPKPSDLTQLQPFIAEALGHDVLPVEQIFKLLPEDATMKDYKQFLVSHMESSLSEVQQTLVNNRLAVQMSRALEEALLQSSQMHAKVSWDDRCALCGLPLRSLSPLKSTHAADECLPPIQVFPSGLAYHTACALASNGVSFASAALPHRPENGLGSGEVLGPRPSSTNLLNSADLVDPLNSECSIDKLDLFVENHSQFNLHLPPAPSPFH